MKFADKYQPSEEWLIFTKKSGKSEAVKLFAESENCFFVKIDAQELSIKDKATRSLIGFINLQTLIVCDGEKDPKGIKQPKLNFHFADNLISLQKIKELIAFVDSFDFSDKIYHF